MGMLGAVVNVYVGQELAAEAVLGKHTFDCAQEQRILAGFDVLVERFLLQALGSGLALSAGIAGVAQEDAIGPFLAGKAHLVGVDDDNRITALNIGRVRRFVFATEDFGNLCTKTAEHLIGSIHYHPAAVYALCVRRKSFVA